MTERQRERVREAEVQIAKGEDRIRADRARIAEWRLLMAEQHLDEAAFRNRLMDAVNASTQGSKGRHWTMHALELRDWLTRHVEMGEPLP